MDFLSIFYNFTYFWYYNTFISIMIRDIVLNQKRELEETDAGKLYTPHTDCYRIF
jgi:hypothetical protein